MTPIRAVLLLVLAVVAAKAADPTPLMLAAASGNTNEVRSLLANGADTDTTDKHGMTALHGAAVGGHADIAKLLVEAGAHTETRGNNGRTPLHYAAHHGNTATVMALLAWTHNEEAKEHGAELDTRDTEGGMTALMYAAGGGWEAAVNVLIAAGAKVDVKDKHNLTAKDYAMVAAQQEKVSHEKASHIVHMLENASAIRQNAAADSDQHRHWLEQQEKLKKKEL